MLAVTEFPPLFSPPPTVSSLPKVEIPHFLPINKCPDGLTGISLRPIGLWIDYAWSRLIKAELKLEPMTKWPHLLLLSYPPLPSAPFAMPCCYSTCRRPPIYQAAKTNCCSCFEASLFQPKGTLAATSTFRTNETASLMLLQ